MTVVLAGGGGSGYTMLELSDVTAGYVPDTVLNVLDDTTGADSEG